MYKTICNAFIRASWKINWPFLKAFKDWNEKKKIWLRVIRGLRITYIYILLLKEQYVDMLM